MQIYKVGDEKTSRRTRMLLLHRGYKVSMEVLKEGETPTGTKIRLVKTITGAFGLYRYHKLHKGWAYITIGRNLIELEKMFRNIVEQDE